MTKVSILIPCYNAQKWIAQAIQSALDQSYTPKEVIVVDDGSTDDSLNIIKSFGDQIIWETGINKGGNTARNRLLELSTGEWLQYLDADDYLLPDKIQEQMAYLSQYPESEVIYSPHITEQITEDSMTYLDLPNYLLTEPEDLWLQAIKWRLPQTGGLLLKKTALLAINGWQEGLKHCQDYDLYVRLLCANKQFTFCPKSGAVYRWWCSGTVTHRNVAEIYHDRLGIQDKIETHLRRIAALTPARSFALDQARFEYARRIYAWDKRWAYQIALGIKQKNPTFQPSRQVAPYFYRQIYNIFGFRMAERIAELKRKLWQS